MLKTSHLFKHEKCIFLYFNDLFYKYTSVTVSHDDQFPLMSVVDSDGQHWCDLTWK